MLAWVVIDRRHHRLADPFALLPCTPSIPSRHLSPLLSTSYRHSCTTAAPQPLYNQSVTHSFHHDGGCTPQPHSESRHSSLPTVFKSFLFRFLRTLLQFFPLFCARNKHNLLVFNRFHTLRQKTRPPGGRNFRRALRGEGASLAK